ncbi:hypothetical protein [Stenotrophomonas indicatrix]|jgi:hypothetical protein|uniref:hypothetical protein n=1 Tax=Stenotrophomonas indicatrix TaxID=2045451 RepID=UPI000EE3CE44|nr:hypothetical protein [Stenotrophomonas indicatrix]MCK6230990.1 hypothetical protein [Stenotrophomonas indicatrix]HCT28889.1 hypothetical protein [Stenotrophomonas sp.]
MQAPLKPKEKAALIAAYGAPNFTLRRTAFGFAPTNHPEKVFTRRLINWLHERVLVRFDDRDLPRAVTLTERGLAEARALVDTARNQALSA